MFDAFLTRLRNLVRRDAVIDEMEQELRYHLEESTSLLVKRGVPPDEAQRDAAKAFGNLTTVREDARLSRGDSFIDDLRRDVRYGLRALGRTPGFTLVVIVTLALGFGVNGAIFAVLKGAMTPQAIVDPSTWLNIPDHWSWEEFQQLRSDTRTMSEWSAADEIWQPRQGQSSRSTRSTENIRPAL